MISDFGLSKMEDSGIMATACGTPGYVGQYEANGGMVEGVNVWKFMNFYNVMFWCLNIIFDGAP